MVGPLEDSDRGHDCDRDYDRDCDRDCARVLLRQWVVAVSLVLCLLLPLPVLVTMVAARP